MSLLSLEAILAVIGVTFYILYSRRLVNADVGLDFDSDATYGLGSKVRGAVTVYPRNKLQAKRIRLILVCQVERVEATGGQHIFELYRKTYVVGASLSFPSLAHSQVPFHIELPTQVPPKDYSKGEWVLQAELDTGRLSFPVIKHILFKPD